MAHNSKKGDVLKMLRFSLVTVAEQTRLGNFEDKLSRVLSFLGGGGGPGQSDKKALTTLFFFCPQLILQKSNG